MDTTLLGKRVRFKHYWFGIGEGMTFVEGIVEGIKGVFPDENVRYAARVVNLAGEEMPLAEFEDGNVRYAVRVVNVPDRVRILDRSTITVTAHHELIECSRDKFEVID